MTVIYSRAQGRAAENASGRSLPDLVRASAAAVEQALFEELGSGQRVLLLVGPGYNGVDALVAGAAAAGQGRQVGAWRALGTVVPDAWSAFLEAGGQEVSDEQVVDQVGQVDLVVDGVFGRNSRPDLPPRVAEVAEACRRGRVALLAIDIPSGLAPDETRPTGVTFHASRTVALGYAGAAHRLGAAQLRCGAVTVASMPFELGEPSVVAWSQAEVAAAWPVPEEADEPTCRVGIDAGSAENPGSGMLACAGALYAGAGLVRYLGTAPIAEQLVAQLPSVTMPDGPVDAWLAGPGWQGLDDAAARLQMALDSGLPLVISDAAVQYLAEHLGRLEVVLTAGAESLAGLLRTPLEEVLQNPPAAARRAAGEYGVTVLLRGAVSCVASPRTAQVQVAVPASAGAVAAGADDVVAGICVALLATGIEPSRAAVLAASLPALTAVRHPGPWPAIETVRRFPATIAELIDR